MDCLPACTTTQQQILTLSGYCYCLIFVDIRFGENNCKEKEWVGRWYWW